METKEKFEKILEWMKQINLTVSTGQKDLADQIKSVESRLNERFDNQSEALKALLTAMRGLRVEHHNDKTRLQEEIDKIKQEMGQRPH